MQDRHTDRLKYFTEQAYTSRKYYIPYINRNIGDLPKNILEIGCGEGGNLLPFAEMGYNVTGVDLAQSRIQQAKQFFKEKNQTGKFIASDIFKLKDLQGTFSLIIIHDVIEHIQNKTDFLKKVEIYLSEGGFIFIAFPAWQMPYGGHQQIARGKIISRLPFIHLFPKKLYKWLLLVCGEQKDTVNELLNIYTTQCTIEKFYSIIKNTNFKVIDRKFFLINPHYEVKFNLSPKELNKKLSSIPVIRNFFSTTCWFILSPR